MALGGFWAGRPDRMAHKMSRYARADVGADGMAAHGSERRKSGAAGYVKSASTRIRRHSERREIEAEVLDMHYREASNPDSE